MDLSRKKSMWNNPLGLRVLSIRDKESNNMSNMEQPKAKA